MEPRVLIIIPAHNEAQSIGAVLSGLRQHVPSYALIVVDDGSTDDTFSLLHARGENVLRLPCNLGYGRALQTGIRFALREGYDLIICMDADGQHRPEDVAGLVQALITHKADLVIGSRYSDGRPYAGQIDRRIGQILFSYLTEILLGHRIHDTTSGFKAMLAPVCSALVDQTFMDFHTEALVRLGLQGYKIIEHPVVVLERTAGRSMHSVASIFVYPLKTLLLTLIAMIDVLLLRRKI
jgi:glycosyltransferase involved in cell wall biosynthesis